MSKRPSFQFYPKDWLSDINVMGMTQEEKGNYITLICLCWVNDGLPNDDDMLEAYCSHSSAIAKPKLCFYLDVDGVTLKHKRLDAEIKKQDEYRKNRSEAGKKGAEKRWMAKPKQSHSKAIAKDGSSSSTSSSTTKKKTLAGKKEPALSTRLQSYFNKRYIELYEEEPIQPSASDVISVNANIKRLVDKYPEKCTEEFFTGLIDFCLEKKCTAFSAMLSSNWINSYRADKKAKPKYIDPDKDCVNP